MNVKVSTPRAPGFFLFPELHTRDGGYLAQMRFKSLTCEIVEEHPEIGIEEILCATYQRRHANVPWLEELLKIPAGEDNRVYCIHYGPHINKLLKKLKGRKVIYFCHSTGWSINMRPEVSVVSVSRHCLAYWAKASPGSPHYLLPNLIEDRFGLPQYKGAQKSPKRPIDVLVLQRKMSKYLLESLVPALSNKWNVHVVDTWDERIDEKMKRAKLFLYDSSSYWKVHKATEGFGLPPLEAMACGCTVFSSLNDGLADFLDPLINCHQLLAGQLESDLEQINATLKDWSETTRTPAVVDQCRAPALKQRIGLILHDIQRSYIK